MGTEWELSPPERRALVIPEGVPVLFTVGLLMKLTGRQVREYHVPGTYWATILKSKEKWGLLHLLPSLLLLASNKFLASRK